MINAVDIYKNTFYYHVNKAEFFRSDGSEVSLSIKEEQLLELLVKFGRCSYRTIAAILYKDYLYDEDLVKNIATIKSRLVSKTGLKIRTIKNFGYILNDEVKFI